MRGIAFELVADMPANRDDALAVLQELRKLLEYRERGIASRELRAGNRVAAEPAIVPT